MQRMLIKAFVALLLVAMVTAGTKLDGHGYKKVVIAISAEVDEDQQLLTRLENILTEASASLFRATKNQVFFKEFFILLPDHWQHQAKYGVAPDVVLEHADIIVDRPNCAHGDVPYVVQSGKCGQEGQYMHLTPGYILQESMSRTSGPPGKVITHEWAHLRWGVFDEYPQDGRDAEFYRKGNKWFATRCSEEIDGFLRSDIKDDECRFDWKTGKPDKHCRFHLNMKTKAVSSLMYAQYLDNVVEFCDHHSEAPKQMRHNHLAPHRQNRLCYGRSVWEVMRWHEDFRKLANENALPDTTDTRPVFRYVQVETKRRVLVLDVSGSMSGEPLRLLRQAATTFILDSIETGSQMGIVEFDDTARNLSNLVTVESNRTTLINRLPSRTLGGTSIGAGLLMGLKVLRSTGHQDGGTIILVSDGGENTVPMISDVTANVTQQGVVVHAIAIGQYAALSMKTLAIATGGKTVFYDGKPNSTSLITGFAATVKSRTNTIRKKDNFVTILTAAGTVESNNTLVGKFYIDSTIGRDTTLTFSYTNDINVDIVGPDGRLVKAFTEYHSKLTNVLKLKLDHVLAAGLYKYKVLTGFSDSRITINVQSRPRNAGMEVLQIHSWMSQSKDVTFDPRKPFSVFAEVKRGMTPVLRAMVTATVDRPREDSIELTLLDNGIGSDIIQDDGIYSAYMLPKYMTGDGRYNIEINVNGTQGQTKVIAGCVSKGGANTLDRPGTAADDVKTEQTGNFERVTTAGEFRVTGYYPTPASQDVLPPARITDFRVKAFDLQNLNAVLIWTSVGGDMDSGQASRYVIYVSHDMETVLRDTTSVGNISDEQVLQGNLSSPSASGQQEEMVIQVKNLVKKDTIYLVVVAVDEAENEGQVSNVVTLSRADELDVSITIAVNTDSASATGTVINMTFLAIFLPVALVIAVITGIALVKYFMKYKKKKAQVEPSRVVVFESNSGSKPPLKN